MNFLYIKKPNTHPLQQTLLQVPHSPSQVQPSPLSPLKIHHLPQHTSWIICNVLLNGIIFTEGLQTYLYKSKANKNGKESITIISKSYNLIPIYKIISKSPMGSWYDSNIPLQTQGGRRSTSWSLETRSWKRLGEWALVKISAVWSVEETEMRQMVPWRIWMKWQSFSMCLVRSWKTSLWAICIALRLSQWSAVADDCDSIY